MYLMLILGVDVHACQMGEVVTMHANLTTISTRAINYR